MFELIESTCTFMTIRSQQKFMKMQKTNRNIDYEIKSQQNKNLVVHLLELILTKKAQIFLDLSMKYLDILNNQLKKLKKKKFQQDYYDQSLNSNEKRKSKL